MLHIQIISDIHIERYGKDIIFKIPIIGDTLLICGDIGNVYTGHMNLLFDYLSPKFKYIIFILGNNDYTRKNINNQINEIEKVAKLYNNVYFLNRSYVIIEGIKFIGCTLWTHIPEKDFSLYKEKLHRSNIKVKQINELHEIDLKYLYEELEKETSDDIVILTHHSPIVQINSKYGFDKFVPYYCNNLDFRKYNIKLFVFGHTHMKCDTIIDGITYINNPLIEDI